MSRTEQKQDAGRFLEFHNDDQQHHQPGEPVKQPKNPKPAPPGRNQNRPSGAIFVPVRIFDFTPENIEIEQKHPATLSER